MSSASCFQIGEVENKMSSGEVFKGVESVLGPFIHSGKGRYLCSKKNGVDVSRLAS